MPAEDRIQASSRNHHGLPIPEVSAGASLPLTHLQNARGGFGSFVTLISRLHSHDGGLLELIDLQGIAR